MLALFWDDLEVPANSDFAQFTSQLDHTVSAAAAIAPPDTSPSLAAAIQTAGITSHLAQDTDLQPYPATIALSSLNGSNGFSFGGASTGTTVDSVDINGDGFDDLVVHAPTGAGHSATGRAG